MEISYYILDCETSGLSPKIHELNQLSIIRCLDRNIINKFIKIEYPENVSPQALTATGRVMADLFKGGTKEEAVEIINNFLNQDGTDPEHRCIIGHNIIRFDRKFVQALWQKCGKVFPANLWLDTLSWSKDYAKIKGIDSKKFTLDACIEMTGIKKVAGNSHEATVDSKNNYLLYQHLKKEGINHLPHMKRFVDEEE